MKKNHLSSFLLFIIFITTACQHDEKPTPRQDDYLLFGHFYGYCIGESCIEIFKLTDTSLLEDRLDQYPNQNEIYHGIFTALSQGKFDLVKSLKDEIPAGLYDETKHVIGQPDAGDWGGVYFAIRENGVEYYWLIDQKDTNLPSYLIPFKNKINQYIAAINQ